MTHFFVISFPVVINVDVSKAEAKSIDSQHKVKDIGAVKRVIEIIVVLNKIDGFIGIVEVITTVQNIKHQLKGHQVEESLIMLVVVFDHGRFLER